MASASAPAGPAAANPADAPPSPATERAQQAALPYTWTQTLADVDISFNVLPRLRGRDIDVRIARNTLHAGVRGEGAVVEGALPHPVVVDDSTWTLETSGDAKEVHVHLRKADAQRWWAHVETRAPRIDTTRLQPEASRLGDLDGETRALVEKMMVEQREKEMGGGPEAAKKREVLRRFQEQHPEMDFQGAEMG